MEGGICREGGAKEREGYAEKGKGGLKGGKGRLMAKVILGLENVVFILTFFFKCWLVEPVRFGSVQSVSDFRNRNRTEPEFFCDFLIG